MSAMARVRILFLSANPDSTTRLALDEELRAIQVRLRQSGAADRIELCAEWALRGDEIPAALMRHRPQIVHFSGHGSSAGELILSASKAGELNTVSAETLRRIFEPLAADISCVVLNACYSALQAKALAEILPCVVGMTRKVKDTAAVAFAAGFYEALAFGESVQTAFKLGCTQIELAQEPGQRDVPNLLLRSGTDAAQVRPLAPTSIPADTRASGVPSPVFPQSQVRRSGILMAASLILLAVVAIAWWQSSRKPVQPLALENPVIKTPVPVATPALDGDQKPPLTVDAGPHSRHSGGERITVEHEGDIHAKGQVNVIAPAAAGETVVKSKGQIVSGGDVNIGVTAPAALRGKKVRP